MFSKASGILGRGVAEMEMVVTFDEAIHDHNIANAHGALEHLRKLYSDGS